MKRILSLAIIIAFTAVGSGLADEWRIDKTHSTVRFGVSHMVISTVHGIFSDFEGTINFNGEDIAPSSVEFTVQTASIDTDDEKRDKHIRSDDFLNAEKYPTMTFKSTSIEAGKDGAFTLTGDLTIRDVTKKVSFDCKFRGVIDDNRGNTRAGFTAATTIKRDEYNVSFSGSLDVGGLLVGNEMELELALEAVKVKPKDASDEDSKDSDG
ncbi:MAG: YceI family protein [candidate division Zixibacteria bacterium]|nr:YceI family protein [candidate division Zixibacteria bacterium]